MRISGSRRRNRVRPPIGQCLLGLAGLAMSLASSAQTDREALERLEQGRAKQQQREAAAMAPMGAAQPGAQRSLQPPLAGELPCFVVYRIEWDDTSGPLPLRLRGLLRQLPGFEGECLGLQSLARLQTNLDTLLLEAGYLTSRVQLPEQNLGDGVLRVQAQLGRVGRVVHRSANGNERRVPRGWLPLQAGEVLNLRDIEQGLENAARLPSLTAQVAIEPGDAPGLSNIVVLHAGARPWRARVSIDNHALGDFGRWQVAASTTVDLGWVGADQISLWHQRSASGLTPTQLQQRSSLSYSTALGAQLLSLTVGQGAHRRRITGTTVEFGETASDHSVQFQLQRVLLRTGGWRLSASLGGEGRQARNFIEDIELLLLRRRSRSWDWGLDGQWRVGSQGGIVNAQLRRQQVLANDPRVELLPDAPPKPRHDSLSFSIQLPLLGGMVHWESAAEWRWVQAPAYGADLQSLGGPGSVRGFDGRQQVVGLRSGVLRQDWLLTPAFMQTPASRQQLAVGLDIGQVGDLDPSWRSPSRERRLAGMALSLRSVWPKQGLFAEIGWAKPLSQPSDWLPTPSRWSLQISSTL
jgi:hemolysin activation/secretion protein